MPSLTFAVIVLGVIVGCCALLSLGAFLQRRKDNPTGIYKFAGFAALAAIIIYVIYTAVAVLTKNLVSSLTLSLAILGGVLGCLALICIGAYFGKKAEVFRVVITCGFIVLAAIIIFVIYSAVFLLTGHSV